VDADAEPKKREKKTFVIDFMDGQVIDERTLFQRGSAIPMLPKESVENHHLLPDDVHFQSRDLLKLFLKPDCKVRGFQNFRALTNPIGTIFECTERSGAGIRR